MSEPNAENAGISERMVIPMDPESNWDICPICRGFIEENGFPGTMRMRERHEAHKREHSDSNGGDR